MNIIDRKLLEIRREIFIEKKRLKKSQGSTTEKITNRLGSLQSELRKYVELANNNTRKFYCSGCGKVYDTPNERNRHSVKEHKK